MELWIRSQNREKLIKTSIVEIEYFRENCDVLINSKNDDLNLGKYKTKKRALEVLDEIQKLLTMQRISIPAHNCNFDKYNSASCIDTQMNIIYEMPSK